MSKDYYNILGLSRSATDAEIKSAYRALAKKYHPDKNSGDSKSADRFKEIGEAYATLSDPDKRRAYDQYGQAGQSPYSGASSGGFSDIFQDIFSRRGAGGGNINLEDILGQAQKRAPSSQTAKLEISFLEAYKGAEKTIQVAGKRLSVRIPAGSRSGTQLRLAGQGQGGDLVLSLEICKDDKYELVNEDLYMQIDVPAPLAALGGSLDVELLSGKAISLSIPSGSLSGRKMRLREQGWIKKGGLRGDLYVRLSITVPQSLSGRERELYKELLDLSTK